MVKTMLVSSCRQDEMRARLAGMIWAAYSDSLPAKAHLRAKVWHSGAYQADRRLEVALDIIVSLPYRNESRKESGDLSFAPVTMILPLSHDK